MPGASLVPRPKTSWTSGQGAADAGGATAKVAAVQATAEAIAASRADVLSKVTSSSSHSCVGSCQPFGPVTLAGQHQPGENHCGADDLDGGQRLAEQDPCGKHGKHHFGEAD